MSRLNRVLAVLFPSVPYRDQAKILAAMEGRTQTPVSTSLGEGGVETGPATTAPTSLGAGGPSGDGAAASERRPVPAQAPPAVETFVDWAAHPSRRYQFTDERLALLLSEWGATS